MRFRHTSQVRASVDEFAAFHTAAASMKAITPPLIPIRLYQASLSLVEGDEISFTMWLGLPLLFAYRGRKTGRLLEGAE